MTSDADFGLNLGFLLLTSDRWIHRRVERFVVEATGECTRFISLDFTGSSQLTV